MHRSRHTRTKTLAIACIFFALMPLACKHERRVTLSVRDRSNTTNSAPRVRRAKHGGTDVTFLAVSDTHFGYEYPADLAELTPDPFTQPVGLEAVNVRLIKHANALAGKAYPHDVGGNVDEPRGLLIAGNLTEWGRTEEWRRFVACYGLTGNEGAIKIPVFEAVGNHDKVPGTWMEDEVAKRHGSRFYSWDWDDLHIASLGEAPDDEGLTWLANDLDGLERDVPVIVYFHFAIEGPYSTGNWFGDGDYKDRLADVLEGHDVIGILHGHHHATGHYTWHGIDVFKIGAVKNGPHLLTVIRVRDTKMLVARYDYDDDTWPKWEEKTIGAGN